MNVDGNHWAFVEINNENNQIIYYDSLASNGKDYSYYTKYFLDFLNNLQKDDGIPEIKIK